MSDISIPLQFRASELPASVTAGTRDPRQPLGTPTTLAWSAAGLFALMSIWFADQASVVWGSGSHLPQMVLILPLGHLAMLAVVWAALRSEGRSFRDYLTLVPLR